MLQRGRKEAPAGDGGWKGVEGVKRGRRGEGEKVGWDGKRQKP